MKKSLKHYYLPLFLCAALIVSAIGVNNWILTAKAGFTYVTAFTVNGGQVPSTQTNFPVLLKPTDARFKTAAAAPGIGHVQNASGFDLRPDASSSCVSPYTYELVPGTYNASTGTFEMWVNVPSLANGSIIYLCYGDTGISTDGSSTGTWDSNFKGVYHLPDGTTLTANDSTSNASTGSLMNAPAAATGQIDGAATFNPAGSQYITMGNVSNMDPGTSDVSISAWIKTTYSGNYQAIFGKGYLAGSTGYGMWVGMTGDAPGQIGFQIRQNGNAPGMYATGRVDDGNWHFVEATVARSSSSGGNIYIDGVLAGTFDPTPLNGISLTTAFEAAISGRDSAGGFTFFVDGSVDETRVSIGIARSADWVATEYNNQSAPGSFYTIGSESPFGNTPLVYSTFQINNGSVQINNGSLKINR